jgi:uncharacterized YccA/Bax inhibitor family protein
MASVLTLRSGNPALTANTFERYRGGSSIEHMTLAGTVNKTALALFAAMMTATFMWTRGPANPSLTMWITIATGAWFALGIATSWKHEWARYTTPVIAMAAGVLLGGVSVLAEGQYPGIVGQAVFLTFGTLASLLAAYRSGLIRATQNFRLGVAAATGGVFLLYIVNFVLGWFAYGWPVLSSHEPVGIVFSLIVVVVAALNLVLDFDFIERGVEVGAPKHMEWYGAFGLLVTLVWLYLEILRLLMKLQARRR